MLPYLIAGAIGFGIGKLFEEGGETFGRGGKAEKKYYWIKMDRSKIDEYIDYASRMMGMFEGEIYTQAPNKVAFDTENDMFAFTSMIDNHNNDNDFQEGDEGYIYYEELFNGEPRPNMFDKIIGNKYEGGGETYQEKVASIKGGVEQYSVDIDLENGDEIRDITSKSLSKSKKEYDKYSEPMIYEGEKISNIQLIVIYKNGDYDTLDSKFSDKYAGGGGVDNPSKKEMLDYLNMYFDYYSELRTIAIEKDNILTRRMLNSLDNEELQMAYEDAKYEIKADTQFDNGGGVKKMMKYDTLVHYVTSNLDKGEKEYLGINAFSKEDAEKKAKIMFNQEDADRYDASIEYVSVWERGEAYKNGGSTYASGGVDLFSMSKTINDRGQISEMVIAENVSVDEFNKLFSDKGYRKVNDNSLVGFYFAKPNGDTIQLIPSFHKKGEIIKYAKGGQASKKGKLNATYIPKRNIKTLTTTYGNTIKGKDLLDGAYTTRKDIRQDPKMVRTIFEEEEFAEFKNGGGVGKFKVGDKVTFNQDPSGRLGDNIYYGTILEINNGVAKIDHQNSNMKNVIRNVNVANLKKFAEGGEIKLRIKNVDSFDKHYDEVGFTKKELSLPKQDSNKNWFTTTNDKSIAQQLISDGFVDKYAGGGVGADSKSKIKIIENKKEGKKTATQTLVKENNKGEKITYELSAGMHTTPKENRYADGWFEIYATDENDDEYFYSEGGLWIENGRIYDYDGVYELSEKLKPLLSALNLNSEDVFSEGGEAKKRRRRAKL
jgi:hypothetical protein